MWKTCYALHCVVSNIYYYIANFSPQNIPLETNFKTSNTPLSRKSTNTNASDLGKGKSGENVINSLEHRETHHSAIAENEYDISSFYDFSNTLSSVVWIAIADIKLMYSNNL